MLQTHRKLHGIGRLYESALRAPVAPVLAKVAAGAIAAVPKDEGEAAVEDSASDAEPDTGVAEADMDGSESDKAIVLAMEAVSVDAVPVAAVSLEPVQGIEESGNFGASLIEVRLDLVFYFFFTFFCFTVCLFFQSFLVSAS
jgi:hypothetical protein